MKIFILYLFFFCGISFAQKKLPPRFSDFQTVKDLLYVSSGGIQYKIKIRNITERRDFGGDIKKTVRGEVTFQKKARSNDGEFVVHYQSVVIPYVTNCDCLLTFSDLMIFPKKKRFNIQTSGSGVDHVLTFFWDNGSFRQFTLPKKTIDEKTL